MPLFKNAIAFRIAPDWTPPASEALEELLQRQCFQPCGPTQPQSVGWLPPRGQEHGAMVEQVAGHWLLRLAVERRAVPASAVRGELDARCKAIEAERGRAPGRKEKAELKEQIMTTLLPRAFTKRATHTLWIDPAARLLVVAASSTRAAEGVLKPLVDLMAELRCPMPLAPLHTASAPAAAMAHWLSTQEPPAGFSLDRDLELKSPGEERSVVRYARHTLEIDEIAQHIQEGKLPTQLAMTWEGRVSFTLTEMLALKKIELLGVEEAPRGEDGFDADATIATSELSALVPELLLALGGETVPGAPAAAAPAPAPAPGAEAEAAPF